MRYINKMDSNQIISTPEVTKLYPYANLIEIEFKNLITIDIMTIRNQKQSNKLNSSREEIISSFSRISY